MMINVIKSVSRSEWEFPVYRYISVPCRLTREGFELTEG